MLNSIMMIIFFIPIHLLMKEGSLSANKSRISSRTPHTINLHSWSKNYSRIRIVTAILYNSPRPMIGLYHV